MLSRTDGKTVGPLSVRLEPTSVPDPPIKVTQSADSVEINTGLLVCRLKRAGQSLIESLAIVGREVARDGRLIVLREDRSAYASSQTVRQESYTSRISSVTVEQSGPVRAIIRIEGTHVGAGAAGEAERQWLPFSVRLYFTAQLTCIRMVHSFVFDGDQFTDFIRGIGVSFTIPFREEHQNRMFASRVMEMDFSPSPS